MAVFKNMGTGLSRANWMGADNWRCHDFYWHLFGEFEEKGEVINGIINSCNKGSDQG